MRRPNRIEVVTGVVLLDTLVLLNWVTWRIFTDPPDIPGGTAGAYATLLGGVPAAYALYRWARSWYEKRNERDE